MCSHASDPAIATRLVQSFELSGASAVEADSDPDLDHFGDSDPGRDADCVWTCQSRHVQELLPEPAAMMVAKGLSPLRESPPPGEAGAEAWAAVERAAGTQHTQRSSSVDASALRGRLQNLKVRGGAVRC